MHIDPKFCHPDDLATLQSFEAVEFNVREIRDGSWSDAELDVALDNAQAVVFTGEASEAYVLIKVVP